MAAKGQVPRMNYQVIWKGPVSKSSGIGTASREYALALHRQGVDVKVVNAATRPLSSYRSSGQLPALINKPYSQGKTKVLIYHGLPHTLDMAQARKQYDYVVLNTVWETTRIPASWFPHINRFDAVFVPSVQNKIAMKTSGVKVPVYIVPHGVNTQQFTPSHKKMPLQVPKGTFVFISVFTFQHRKNPETLVRAFWEEFSAADKVALLIKTSGLGPNETDGWIKGKLLSYKKKLGFGNRAPVYIVTKHASPEKMKSIYATGNAFVLPTRGEGVGLPFLEALSSGVPVIATGWGGHMDFLNSRNSFLVDYKLNSPAASMKRSISRNFSQLFAQKGQRWAEPSLASLRRQMRYAYEHPELCRKKGLRGRQDMRSWSWNRSGALLKKAVEAVIRLKKSK